MVHSPFIGKSKNSSRPSDESHPFKLEKGTEKKSVYESQEPLAANPKVGTSKFSKLPVKDEPSRLRAEEMRKRQSAIASSKGLEQKTAAVVKMEVPIKKETPCAEESVLVAEDKKSLVISNEMQPDTSVPEKKACLPNSYYCQVSRTMFFFFSMC